MELKDKIGTCKVVAQAILSDAEVTDTERAVLQKLMDRYGLDKDQRREVLRRNVDDDPAAMVQGISDPEAKKEMLTELTRAIAADGKLSEAEERLLGRVGEAVGLSEAEMEKLVADFVE
jgi:uncharacterized tellurite resistance protein B-like protein